MSEVTDYKHRACRILIEDHERRIEWLSTQLDEAMTQIRLVHAVCAEHGFSGFHTAEGAVATALVTLKKQIANIDADGREVEHG